MTAARKVGVVAQVPDNEAPKVSLAVRVEPALKLELERAHEIERAGPPARPMLKVGRTHEYALGLGLDLYFALETLGGQKLTEVAAHLDGDRREALSELLRRGLDSWDRECGGGTKKGKK